MNTTNELIAIINDVRSKGSDVKTIRKQKFAPADFYMSLTNGKQVGPIKCQGTPRNSNANSSKRKRCSQAATARASRLNSPF
jgi:hypothetical protein